MESHFDQNNHPFVLASQDTHVRIGLAEILTFMYREMRAKLGHMYSFNDEEMLTTIMKPALNILDNPKVRF
jgi:hypothetical protein